MQRRLSAFNDYAIEAPDGHVGTVADILVQDDDWKLRWFVVNAGSWLFGRQVLVHPAILGRPDIRQHAFPVSLSIAEMEACRDITSDPPVCRQIEQSLYAWDETEPLWYAGGMFGDRIDTAGGMMPHAPGRRHQGAAPAADRHLRSVAQLVGYHIHALDGDIGHLEDFLVEDETWQIEQAVVDTSNWGFGRHVLVPAAQIRAVDWGGRYIRIDQTRYSIKSGPSWQEVDSSSVR